MLLDLLQRSNQGPIQTYAAWFRHAGAAGLFFLAILDSSPVPTFGGPDILIAILSASHRNPWYEYAAVATAGSVIGAFITFHIGQKAGLGILNRYGDGRVAGMLRMFQRWGTGVLAASTAVPVPFPTSLFFVAAGASKHRRLPFLATVAVCRAVRYSAVAIVADIYGRHFIRVLRHPSRYWGWLLLFCLLFLGLLAIGMLINKRLMAPAPISLTAEES